MSTTRLLRLGEVPLLDLSDYRSTDGDKRDKYFRNLEQSLRLWGFLTVAGHEVDLDLLERCYDLSERFFAQPGEVKQALLYTAVEQREFSNVGYFPYRSEHAVRSAVADTKEFFHMGPELSAEHPMRAYYADNVWPDVAGFQEAFTALFAQLERCGDHLIHSIAEHAGIGAGYLDEFVAAGAHVLRTVHYPPIPLDGVTEWAAAHTGIQLLGLQPRTAHPGLEIELPSGEWVAPTEEFAEYLLINIGEMLAYLLGGRVQPTLHRVVSRYATCGELSEHRYAIVFFYHANSLQTLRPVTEAGGAPPLQAGAWLRKRLHELGL